MEKTADDNWIVTIQQRHNLPRDDLDFDANRYETFGPYSSETAEKVADKIVATGYKVLIHQLSLWPN